MKIQVWMGDSAHIKAMCVAGEYDNEGLERVGRPTDVTHEMSEDFWICLEEQRLTDALVEKINATGLTPVSYTHLTLPTIHLV